MGRETGATATIAVVVAASLFGLTGTIAASGPDALSPVAAGVWRSVIGGIALCGIAWVSGTPVWGYPWRSRWTIVGAVGVAGYQLAFFEAVARTGVALGTLVTIASGPVFAGLLDAVVQRRPPGRRWALGTALAVTGVAVLSSGSLDVDAGGVALAVLAGASFPLFGLAAQRLMDDRPFLPAMALVFGAGMVALAPIAAITVDEAVATIDSLMTVGALGVVTLAVAYWLWGLGLERLSLSAVVTLTLVEPAVASVLAVVILDEPFGAALALGLVLVAAGVVISAGESTRDRLPAAIVGAGSQAGPAGSVRSRHGEEAG